MYMVTSEMLVVNEFKVMQMGEALQSGKYFALLDSRDDVV